MLYKIAVSPFLAISVNSCHGSDTQMSKKRIGRQTFQLVPRKCSPMGRRFEKLLALKGLWKDHSQIFSRVFRISYIFS